MNHILTGRDQWKHGVIRTNFVCGDYAMTDVYLHHAMRMLGVVRAVYTGSLHGEIADYKIERLRTTSAGKLDIVLSVL